MGPVPLFRLSARLYTRGHLRLARLVKAVNFALFRVLIPAEVKAGPNLRFGHYGTGVVIHPNTRIGSDVYIHHNVTLGTDTDFTDPAAGWMVVGDRVSIGAGAIVLGPIKVGDNAVIGAGAVVTADVPPGGVVVGVPGRVISHDGKAMPRHP